MKPHRVLLRLTRNVLLLLAVAAVAALWIVPLDDEAKQYGLVSILFTSIGGSSLLEARRLRHDGDPRTRSSFYDGGGWLALGVSFLPGLPPVVAYIMRLIGVMGLFAGLRSAPSSKPRDESRDPRWTVKE